ncbi:putative glutamyl-tRNA synthetase [Leptomonas seymouri]|uniref:glutamate--tRNA ligase n=1 Tax=Leptomonas seymouri TaxID=5684 RepID=A0A0N0P4H9_LEPSE|nr:putative glutamyl-tRNA synthetase [Leptomonas seymouri]|eukprot:KPI84847.1 putative glutamyl-tRNA synthetase [Leptomonas seymouri]
MSINIHLKALTLTKTYFASAAKAESKDKLFLTNGEQGKVVTRFPPEASGFLHIGHAKAALINRMLANKYEGKMLFRFDDTNPSKEKEHFETAIEDDLKTLGVSYDSGPTYSSDYFDVMFDKAEDMIKRGLAYCDKTPREEMQKCRFDGIPTKYRDTSVEENLRLFNEMRKGTEEGQQTCLRAKVSIDDPNKAMRDPVMYRVNLEPHARHGTKQKAYPTYDFCCPIIDSIEGVTHALRTNEYHDRNAQYYWFCDAMNLRKPLIEDFSRLNMEYSVMSKRKLTKLVDTHVVDGWDDPRFPTVRALVRRGMKIEALRQFVAEQGMSKTVNFMEWSKIWYFNTQILDPVSPRYTVVSNTLKVRCTVEGQSHMEVGKRALHKKNAELGEKTYYKSDVIFLDAEDVFLIKDGDEVTLMDWCNAYVKDIKRPSADALPTEATIVLNPQGDVKKTKFKFTWVPENEKSVILTLNEYDHLLTKAKPEPDETLDDIIAPVSRYTQEVLGEEALSVLKKGDIVQLERRGYYIVDDDSGEKKVLIYIPDGRDKINHLSAKAQYLKTLPKKASAADELAAKRAAKAAQKAAQKAAAAAKKN